MSDIDINCYWDIIVPPGHGARRGHLLAVCRYTTIPEFEQPLGMIVWWDDISEYVLERCVKWLSQHEDMKDVIVYACIESGADERYVRLCAKNGVSIRQYGEVVYPDPNFEDVNEDEQENEQENEQEDEQEDGEDA